jgi:hypothetical protein
MGDLNYISSSTERVPITTVKSRRLVSYPTSGHVPGLEDPGEKIF